MENKNPRIVKVMQTGVLAALCFVSFTFLSVKIPVGGDDAVSLHIGNAFCVLAALLLGGWYGGISGAIGMTISDLLDPTYAIGAPKTFVLKLCIGLVTGLIAHKFAKIDQSSDLKYIAKWTIIASIGGLGFNVIFDPVVGYFYKQYILGQPQQIAAVLAKISVFATFINAIVSVILVNIIYNAIRPVLKKSGLLLPVGRNNSNMS